MNKTTFLLYGQHSTKTLYNDRTKETPIFKIKSFTGKELYFGNITPVFITMHFFCE